MSNNWQAQLNIDIAENGSCGRKITFSLPAAAVDELINSTTREVARNVQLPGFRTGKAPVSMVKSRFTKTIMEEADRKLMVAAYSKMAEEAEKLDIVSYSRMQPSGALEAGKDFSMSADVEIAPSIELPDFSSYGKDVENKENLEEHEARILDQAKEYFSSFEPITDAVKEGDMLNVSYETDLELAEDATDLQKRAAKNENAWFLLREPEQVPGMIAALTGAVIGGEYNFSAEYPADWREEFLQGKKVAYKVKVISGQRRIPVSDDAALAEKLGAKSVEEMKEEFHKRAIAECEMAYRRQVMDAIQTCLLAETPAFELPAHALETAVENEFNVIANKKVTNDEEARKFQEEKEQYREEVTANATETVRKQFILRKIAKQEKVTVSEEEISAEIQRISSYTGIEAGKLVNLLQQSGRIGELEIELLVDKTLGVLADKVIKA